MRQFRKFQACPPVVFSTDINLHGMNQRRRYRHTDWSAYHRAYVLEWVDRTNQSRNMLQIHQRHDFVRYLEWLHGVARLQFRPAMTHADIGEGDSSNEVIVDDYDEFTWTGTQLERAPSTLTMEGSSPA